MPRKAKIVSPSSVRKPRTVSRKQTGKPLVESMPVSQNWSLKLKKSYLLVGLIVVLVLSLLYYYRGLFIAATVNGAPISRLAVITELEKQGGKQALNMLITKKLITQEAAKRKITVSDQEVNAEIKKIEDTLAKRGQKLDEALASQGSTRQDLVEQIRLQKMLEKMVGKDIKVSDQEVKDYMDKNKDTLPAGTTPASIKQQLYQQKLNTKIQSFLADLQKKAKIDYIVKY